MNCEQKDQVLNEETSADGQPIDAESRITLGLLNAVHENSGVSQRSLSNELGIALGLTNAYLKRCVRKGLVKMAQAPANRYAYYLTPQGFAEKSRLTARYLRRSFDFYREARNECEGLLHHCVTRGWRRIALGGLGELAEIAVLCSLQHDVQLIAVIDARVDHGEFMKVPIKSSVDAASELDAIVLTDVAKPQQTYDTLASKVPPGRILTPPLLKVSRTQGAEGSSEQ
ncbi:MAG: MarR family transcriptional regulator [Alphaproteobacteria bacterium]|nr:MarR family transcriptional regulator [Alphaproteobacteria bacterium]